MKKQFLLIATMLICYVVYAQTPKVNWVDSINHYFNETSLIALSSSLGYSSEDIEKTKSLPDSIFYYTYKSPIIENEKTKNWILDVHTNALKTGSIRLNTMSSYWRPILLPYKQGSAIMLRNFVSKYVYNTHNMGSERERATYAVQAMFLPLIYALVENDVDVKSQYIGFTFFYSHKDFTEKYALADYGSVTVVFPTADLKKLQQYQITEDDFLKQCDFYLKEKCGAVRFQYILK